MKQLRIISIKIKNYSYWENLEVNFPEGKGLKEQKILIYGKNGTGKSAFARALRWLAVGDIGLDNMDHKKSFPKWWKGLMNDSQKVEMIAFHEKYGRISFWREREKGVDETEFDFEILDTQGYPNKDLFWESVFGDRSRRNPGFYFSPAKFLEECKDVKEDNGFLEKKLNFSRCGVFLEQLKEVKNKYTKQLQAGVKNKQNKKDLIRMGNEIENHLLELKDLKDEKKGIQKFLELQGGEDSVKTLELKIEKNKNFKDVQEDCRDFEKKFENYQQGFRDHIEDYCFQMLCKMLEKDSEKLKSFEKACKFSLPFGDFLQLVKLSKESRVELEKLQLKHGDFSDIDIRSVLKRGHSSKSQDSLDYFEKLVEMDEDLGKKEDKLIKEKRNLPAGAQKAEEILEKVLNNKERFDKLNKKEIPTLEELLSEKKQKKKKLEQKSFGEGASKKMLEKAKTFLKVYSNSRELFYSKKFHEIIEGIQDFWSYVVDDNSWKLEYKPQAEGGHDRQTPFVLRIGTDSFRIEQGSEDGQPSNGQTKIATFAILYSFLGDSGFPPIIDDAGQEVDEEKYPRFLEFISSKYAQMIVLTHTDKDFFDDFDSKVEFVKSKITDRSAGNQDCVNYRSSECKRK